MKIKKIITALVCAALLTSATVATLSFSGSAEIITNNSENIAITADVGSVAPGEYVTITLSNTDKTLAGVELQVGYDKSAFVLESDNAVDGGTFTADNITASYDKEENPNGHDLNPYAVIATTGDAYAAGTVGGFYLLKFKALDAAVDGQYNFTLTGTIVNDLSETGGPDSDTKTLTPTSIGVTVANGGAPVTTAETVATDTGTDTGATNTGATDTSDTAPGTDDTNVIEPGADGTVIVGELTGDTTQNALDAVVALEIYAKLSEDTFDKYKFEGADYSAADVDQSGAVNALDAVAILEKYAKIAADDNLVGESLPKA